MIRNSILFFAFVSLVTIASCSRCKQCSYTYKNSGIDTTKTFAKECGNTRKTNAYENNSKAEAARYNATSDSCVSIK
jgi:hypothetical protein